MVSRLLRPLLFAGLCLVLSPGLGLAQNDNGPGNNNENGNATGQDNGNGPGNNNGNGPGSNNGNGPGNDNGPGNNGNDSPVSPPPPAPTSIPASPSPSSSPPSASSPTTSDQDVALKAVEDERALPFEAISKLVHETNPGEIIDARLLSVDGILLYEVKVLNGGELNILYYYARSGRRVGG
jgi:hypothetical protein